MHAQVQILPIDCHFEADYQKKKIESNDKDKTVAKDKETKTSKSVFFSNSSALAAAENESSEPIVYVVTIDAQNRL
jgi:hypothetical protein